MTTRAVTSLTNPTVKAVRALHMRKTREETGQFVAEAIMDPETTPLLAAALAAGCRIQKGLPMLECQIALMARHMDAL